jgi:hypothetical protein
MCRSSLSAIFLNSSFDHVLNVISYVKLDFLWLEQCLDRTPLVHRAVAFRYLVEGQS